MTIVIKKQLFYHKINSHIDYIYKKEILEL